MTPPTRKWSKEQLESDEVSKKDIISFIQEVKFNAIHIYKRIC